MLVTKRNGTKQEFMLEKIHEHCRWMTDGLSGASQSELETSCTIQFYEGMPTSEIHESIVTAAADKVDEHDDWAKVAARGLQLQVYKEVTGGKIEYGHLRDYLNVAVACEKVTAEFMAETCGFRLDELDAAIDKERDFHFDYLGLKTLVDRYLKRDAEDNVVELPQHFFMRVAMGIAMAEKPEERTERAIEFYDTLSSFDFMSSTPTLFNSGTNHPQLSSCFLLTMGDALEDIFGALEEAAQYSKFSGGLGMDFTYIRASGAPVKGTGGIAGGIVPYMKLYNDVLNGFDQGGKRPGAGAAYLENWHADFEAFLLLRKNTGDERQRAHDIFTASWISDLFMERLGRNEEWSLFDPNDVPELHDAYGDTFKALYEDAENRGLAKKTMPAMELWQKMIGALFENGSAWPCFKDHVNNRNMQKGSGVVHSSNLCTEITLNTRVGEVSAVCNLGSVNMSRHVEHGEINYGKLRKTVRTAIRMLDNVIEIGLIPHKHGRAFNELERAIGLGMMGLTEMAVQLGVDFESQAYLDFNNELTKAWSYYAIEASADLAQERGSYPLFDKSEWAKGILPYDSANDNARALVSGTPFYGAEAETALRAKVSAGMRNSNVMAIAPTATIANITGTTACTELPLLQQYSKSNLSGNFTVRSPLLKYGRPDLAKTARAVDQKQILRATAVRQIYIDQAQSTNLFLPLDRDVSGKELSSWYTYAWYLGLKTTYYLKSVSASERESIQEYEAKAPSEELIGMDDKEDFLAGVTCSLDNPEACESCQ